MAMIRAEKNAYIGDKPIYDGIVELCDDLTDIERDGYAVYGGSRLELGPGSILYCCEDKQGHILQADGTFVSTKEE